MHPNENDGPTPESVRAVMGEAWRDHRHARDQTWRALQIEAVLGAGLVTVDAQFHNIVATAFAGALTILAAASGLLISWHHRKLQRQKFIHISNYEEWLCLHREDLMPKAVEGKDTRPEIVRNGAVSVPKKLRYRDVIDPRVHNTALFILRMHLVIMAFGILMITVRAWVGSR